MLLCDSFVISSDGAIPSEVEVGVQIEIPSSEQNNSFVIE
jgi:hypothetical protein